MILYHNIYLLKKAIYVYFCEKLCAVTIQIRLQKRFDPIVVNKVEARKGQSFRQTTGLAETFQLKVRGQLVMRLVGKETTKKKENREKENKTSTLDSKHF